MTTGAGFAHDSSNPSQPPAGSAVVPGIHFGAAGVIASLRAARFLTRSAAVRPACWNLVIPRCLRPHLGSRCHCVCVCGGGSPKVGRAQRGVGGSFLLLTREWRSQKPEGNGHTGSYIDCFQTRVWKGTNNSRILSFTPLSLHSDAIIFLEEDIYH